MKKCGQTRGRQATTANEIVEWSLGTPFCEPIELCVALEVEIVDRRKQPFGKEFCQSQFRRGGKLVEKDVVNFEDPCELPDAQKRIRIWCRSRIQEQQWHGLIAAPPRVERQEHIFRRDLTEKLVQDLPTNALHSARRARAGQGGTKTAPPMLAAALNGLKETREPRTLAAPDVVSSSSVKPWIVACVLNLLACVRGAMGSALRRRLAQSWRSSVVRAASDVGGALESSPSFAIHRQRRHADRRASIRSFRPFGVVANCSSG